MQSKIKTAGHVLLIPQEDIIPNRSQPRSRFDADALESLAESIRQNGILQPLLVRRITNGMFELIAGERRLRAARFAGVQRVPCVVLDVSDARSAVFALLENMQRQDLGFFEEAEAMSRLMTEYNLTQDEIAVRLGKAPSTVSNKLRLLRLPDDVRRDIVRNGLTERHARALLKLETKASMRDALDRIIRCGMNVAQTEAYIAQLLQPQKTLPRQPLKLFKDVRLFVNTLNHAVDTMRRAGIEAEASRSETDAYIEYVVRIPKAASHTVHRKLS